MPLADEAITSLSLASTASDTDLMLIARSGASKSLPASTLRLLESVAPTNGAAAAAVAMRFGSDGPAIKVIDETLSVADTAAAYDLTEDVPDDTAILCVQLNIESAVAATTATKIGVGTSGDPDKYGKTSVLTQNAKISMIPTWAALGSAEDVQVFAVDDDGVAAGTLDVGSVRVRIVYLEVGDLVGV